MRKPLIAIALLVAAVFGTGYLVGQLRGITPISAATPAQSQTGTGRSGAGHFGPKAGGQVTGVNGSTITIKPSVGRDGQPSTVTTVQLTGTTQYFAGPGTSASKDAIKVGTYIIARGTLSTDGKALTASQVMILQSAPTVGGFGHFGPKAGGKVTAINGNTVTVTPFAGPMGRTSTVTSIVLTGTTTYSSGRGSAATRDSIKVGSYIAARGNLSADGKTLTATQVEILPGAPGTGGFGHSTGPYADGQVTAVNGNTISIKPDVNKPGSSEHETVTTIVLTSSTQYVSKGSVGTSAATGKDAIKVGTFVIARGTLSSDGKTLTATQVMVLPSAPSGGFRQHGQFGQFGQFGRFGFGDQSRYFGQSWRFGNQNGQFNSQSGQQVQFGLYTGNA